MSALAVIYLLLAELSDLVAAIVLSTTEWEGIGALLTLRHLLVFALFAVGFLRADLPAMLRWSCGAYLGVIGLYVLAGLGGEAGIGLVVRSAAKLALPAILVVAGFAALRTAVALRRYRVVLVCFGLASMVFGLWERQNTGFWTDFVEYGEYLSTTKEVLSGFRPDVFLPFNFYGYDQFEGLGLARRAAGLVASPLAQGTLLAFCALIGFAGLRTRSPWIAGLVLCLLGYGVYASGTRGALLMLVIALPLFIVLTQANLGRLGRDGVLLALGFAASFQALAAIYGYTVEMEDGSTIGHLWALQDNFINAGGVLLIGDGLGAAGTLAASADLDVTGGLEGAVFSALYQIGGPGALAFLWVYGAVIVLLFRRRQPGPEGEIAAAMVAFAVGASTSLVISDSLMSLSGMAPFWLAAGGVIASVAEPARRRADPVEAQGEAGERVA
ncbi:hypothetical protein CKO38_00565 [Rhodospirillum rubrum]|uniref:hypothetical protein n=1 Tax=Rhodospirillum rubrum TaxID=1085 RepID=UPI0019067A25|nr:hypothetical protein [Rhodospirillum rubrum]MBK1663169.1 hypothetical protein [Rhodospirillum rubrum]MBK1675186.1 hypothetical protein [Rhodospirillum rubrum]